MRTIKYMLYLILLATVGFAIYAGVADLPPPTAPQQAPAPPPAGG